MLEIIKRLFPNSSVIDEHHMFVDGVLLRYGVGIVYSYVKGLNPEKLQIRNDYIDERDDKDIYSKLSSIIEAEKYKIDNLPKETVMHYWEVAEKVQYIFNNVKNSILDYQQNNDGEGYTTYFSLKRESVVFNFMSEHSGVEFKFEVNANFELFILLNNKVDVNSSYINDVKETSDTICTVLKNFINVNSEQEWKEHISSVFEQKLRVS